MSDGNGRTYRGEAGNADQESFVKEGGSADSVDTSSHRFKLLLPSGMWASFLLEFADGAPPPANIIYQPGYTCKQFFMAHTLEEKKKLLNRVRRIRGQVEAIDRALEQEMECSDILHNISACRGAMDALMAEVIEGHIRFHILDPDVTPTDEQAQAADDLIHALRAYLK
jgi:DNA-binding FrmR family transcriptional regulator